jgi:nitroreductase
LQNWRFIAVRSPTAKARLRPIAWDQPPATDAAVIFIVCGQLVETSVLRERLAPVVEAGVMPPSMVSEWEILARDLYTADPQQRRDETIRTATFGAAAIIYAARSLGFGSLPMIGFDAPDVHREFGLTEEEFPVMLLAVGPEGPGNWPQKPPRPLSDVLDLV